MHAAALGSAAVAPPATARPMARGAGSPANRIAMF